MLQAQKVKLLKVKVLIANRGYESATSGSGFILKQMFMVVGGSASMISVANESLHPYTELNVVILIYEEKKKIITHGDAWEKAASLRLLVYFERLNEWMLWIQQRFHSCSWKNWETL